MKEEEQTYFDSKVIIWDLRKRNKSLGKENIQECLAPIDPSGWMDHQSEIFRLTMLGIE